MHRTDADSNVSNRFDPGDPLVPRLPTQIDAAWLNAVQEELANVITADGTALIKGTWTQLLGAVVTRGTDQIGADAISGRKQFDNGIQASGGSAARAGVNAFGGISGSTHLSAALRGTGNAAGSPGVFGTGDPGTAGYGGEFVAGDTGGIAAVLLRRGDGSTAEGVLDAKGHISLYNATDFNATTDTVARKNALLPRSIVKAGCVFDLASGANPTKRDNFGVSAVARIDGTTTEITFSQAFADRYYEVVITPFNAVAIYGATVVPELVVDGTYPSTTKIRITFKDTTSFAAVADTALAGVRVSVVVIGRQ